MSHSRMQLRASRLNMCKRWLRYLSLTKMSPLLSTIWVISSHEWSEWIPQEVGDGVYQSLSAWHHDKSTKRARSSKNSSSTKSLFSFLWQASMRWLCPCKMSKKWQFLIWSWNKAKQNHLFRSFLGKLPIKITISRIPIFSNSQSFCVWRRLFKTKQIIFLILHWKEI